jgi:hypothetical protein
MGGCICVTELDQVRGRVGGVRGACTRDNGTVGEGVAVVEAVSGGVVVERKSSSGRGSGVEVGASDTFKLWMERTAEEVEEEVVELERPAPKRSRGEGGAALELVRASGAIILEERCCTARSGGVTPPLSGEGVCV